MKILQIPTGGLFSDGILSCIIGYMNEMDKAGMDIRILATNSPDEEIVKRIIDSGCKVVYIPYRKKNIIKYFFELVKYIKKENIDIVHVHGSSSIITIELLAAFFAGCKVRIAHSHNTTCEHKKLDKILRPLFYILKTESFACGEEAGKWMFGNRNYTIIHNARNLHKFEFNKEKRIQIRRKYSIPNDAIVIGHVGRFNTQKNHKYLINIFANYSIKHKDAVLVLIGFGEKFDEIKEQVRILKLEKKVIFVGETNNVADYLSAFDIMLFPSLNEGLPLVVIEWQISGLPCIISSSITKECAITKLVKYESIEANPEVWVKDVEEIKLEDRNVNKGKIFADIKNAGYDIHDAAIKLRELYWSFID